MTAVVIAAMVVDTGGGGLSSTEKFGCLNFAEPDIFLLNDNFN